MSDTFSDLRREAPAFNNYFFTAIMARLANEGLKLALILTAAETPAGLALGGLLVAAFLIPSVVSAPFVGRMADLSHNPTRLYAAAFAFHGLMIGACGLLLEHVPSAVILLMAAIGGSVGPLLMGGMSSLVGSIVPKELINRAYAMDVVTYNVSSILAPAAVAAVAGFTTPLISLLMLAVILQIAAVNMLRLPLRRSEDRAIILPPSPVDGFRAIGGIAPLRSTVVCTSLNAISWGVLPVVATMLAATTFSVNAGVLLSTMAAGALVGSLAYAARPFGMDRPHEIIPVISMVTAIPLIILAFTGNTPLALILFAMKGLLGGPMGATQFAVRDRFSPTNVRTQVFTLSTSVKTTASALGAAMAGMMSGASPAVLILIASGAIVLGAVIAWVDLRLHPEQSRARVAPA